MDPSDARSRFAACRAALHQSCLVLTSREAPAEFSVLGERAVRAFELGGLGVDDVHYWPLDN
jgi:hypothetical protein